MFIENVLHAYVENQFSLTLFITFLLEVKKQWILTYIRFLIEPETLLLKDKDFHIIELQFISLIKSWCISWILIWINDDQNKMWKLNSINAFVFFFSYTDHRVHQFPYFPIILFRMKADKNTINKKDISSFCFSEHLIDGYYLFFLLNNFLIISTLHIKVVLQTWTTSI